MIIRLAGLLLWCAGAAFSQERLTLDRALTLAFENNPQLRVASAQRQGAEAGILTARAYPNPELNVMTGGQFSRPYGRNGMSPGPAGLLQHYSVDQRIDLPSVREARIATARLGRESSEFALVEARLSVRATVKQLFYQVLRRKNEITLAEENLRLIEELRRRIQVQVDVGEAARLELTRAEAEVATARNQARSAELRYVNAVASLGTVVGTSLTPQYVFEGTLDPPTAMPPLPDLRTEVLSRHPFLLQAQADVRRAAARLRTEQAMRTPQPTVRSEYENQPDLRYFRIGVSIPLPLWNKREGPIGEAQAGLNQARAYAELRRLELTAALERAYGLYEVATQQVDSFQTGVLREADAAVRAAEAAYRFGERGIIEVLDAQRVLRSVRLDFLNAQYDLQAALIDIEQLRAQDPLQDKP